MKKNLFKRSPFSGLLLFILLFTYSGMSQSQSLVLADAFTESHSVSLVTDNPSSIVLRFNVNQMDLEQIQAENFGSMSIAISGDAPQIMQKGNPDLFFLNGSVIIPDFGSTELMIETGEYVEYNDIDIAPSKGVLTRDVNPMDIPYEKGELYEKDAFFPGELASLREPYILRDYRGQVVDVYPIQYNPVTKTLRVYKDITVTVVAKQTKGINEFIDKRANAQVLAEFDRIYSRNFLNYAPSVKYTPVDEEGFMLVVAHADYMEAVKPLVNWKNQKGQPTRLVSYTEAGGSPTALKAYITDQYNSDEGLAFVLLVGDSQHIKPLSKSGDSDAAYGHIVGSDSYAEAFIGRFSAETVQHAESQVARIITYERDLTASDTWLKTGMGIASNEGSNPSDIQHMNAIRDKLLGYTYDIVHQVHQPTGTAANVVTNINNGLGIINYVGHGSLTSWGTTGFGLSHMSSLTNVDKLPFIVSVACVNGDFVNKTCFAEGFMRASKSEGPTGAIGIFASTINQSWVPPMTGQNEMIAILTESYTDNIKRTYGGIAINGCMKMNDVHGSGGYSMTNTWVIFGDPSLVVRTDTPSEMVLTHNPTLFLGTTSFTVSSDTEGALVAISYVNTEGETVLLGKAIVEGGSATVSFDEPIVNPLDLTVTATSYNKVTYTGEVSAVPADEPYVILKSFQTVTSPDYGETVSLDVILENISEDPYTASSVSATLTSDSPYVTITDSNVDAGIINPDQEVELDGAFSFSIQNNVPDQTSLEFTIAIEGQYNSEVYNWEQNFIIKANAPILEYGTLTIDDTNGGNGNGILDPGESAKATIVLSNVGHADVSAIVAELSTTGTEL
ncbi:MAG: C25 family cysteine peptidase, partial [Bacteroidales bacterium]|nr:C25 family cysteine peptidase [Bacteroidales bacterium]